MESLPLSGSSSISWAGYDPENKVLHVRYVDNSTEYEYENVPGKKWKELKKAGSKGQYINFYIKPFHKVIAVE
jgi:hypothetical protein